MEINNISEFTYEEIIDNSFEAANFNSKKIIVAYVFLIIMAVLSMALYISGENTLWAGIIFLFMFFFILFFRKATKKQTEKAALTYKNGIYYEYTFTDKKIKINVKYDENTANSSINLEGILKVRENEKCYFLFINKVNYYAVRKNGFNEGELDKFDKLITPYKKRRFK